MKIYGTDGIIQGCVCLCLRVPVSGDGRQSLPNHQSFPRMK
jgi:hypothetical protein